MSFSAHGSSDGELVSQCVPSLRGSEDISKELGHAGSTHVDTNALSGVVSNHGSEMVSEREDVNPGSSMRNQRVQSTDKATKLAIALQRKGVTTLMIRNVPVRVTQKMLLEKLMRQGFYEFVDFVYLPCFFETKLGKGYAFVNCLTSTVAADFVSVWHMSQIFGCDAVLNVSAAAVQGFDANVKKWDRFKRIRNPDLRPYTKATASEGDIEAHDDDVNNLVQVVTEQDTKKSDMPMRLDDLHLCRAKEHSALTYAFLTCPPGLASFSPDFCNAVPFVDLQDMSGPAYVPVPVYW